MSALHDAEVALAAAQAALAAAEAETVAPEPPKPAEVLAVTPASGTTSLGLGHIGKPPVAGIDY